MQKCLWAMQADQGFFMSETGRFHQLHHEKHHNLHFGNTYLPEGFMRNRFHCSSQKYVPAVNLPGR